MRRNKMTNEGDTKLCPLCREEGRNGTWTWKRQPSVIGGDGELWVWEWACDLDRQHNRRHNEPV